MDAGFHLAKKEHEKTEAHLRNTISKEEAAELVRHAVENGPRLIHEHLEPYARGNDPRRRIAEIPKDHPYEAAAMIIDSREEIEQALQEETQRVQSKQQDYADRFDALLKGKRQ